jgi:hypothetical protein
MDTELKRSRNRSISNDENSDGRMKISNPNFGERNNSETAMFGKSKIPLKNLTSNK